MKTTSQHSQRARIVTPARGPQVLLYSRAPKPSKGDGPDEHGAHGPVEPAVAGPVDVLRTDI